MADKVLFANNAVGELAQACAIADTSLVLVAGQGARFPSPGVAEHFVITLQDPGPIGETEIVHCTARVNDVLTITRGQEGTSPRTFPIASLVEMRVTAGVLGGLGEDTGLYNALSITNNTVLTTDDVGKIVVYWGTANVNLTLPPLVDIPDHVQFRVLNRGSGNVTIVAPTGVLNDQHNKVVKPGQDAFIIRESSNWFIARRARDPDAYITSTGGAFTSNLTVSKASPFLILTRPAAGTQAGVISGIGSSTRWNMILGDSSAESGGNAGSNFGLYRYDDAGALIGSALFINRASGQVTTAGTIVSQQNIQAHGQIYSNQNGLTMLGYSTAGSVYLVNGLIATPATGEGLAIQAIHEPGVWFGWRLWLGPSSQFFDFKNDGTIAARQAQLTEGLIMNGHRFEWDWASTAGGSQHRVIIDDAATIKVANSNNIVQLSFDTNAPGALYVITDDGQGWGHSFFTSDERVKKNFASAVGDHLGIIQRIDLKSFDYIGSGVHVDAGMVAQALRDIDPGLVDQFGTYLSVNVLNLCARLIGAVQTLAERVAELEDDV